MSEFNINLSAGEKKRLLTGGKYCPDDIVVEAVGVDEDAIFEAGKQAEYDRFWSAYQANGARKGYNYGFAGISWTAETFRPKYDIISSSSLSMFQQFASTMPTSLKQILTNQGVTLTFPNCMNINNLFSNAGVTEIGVLDFSTITRFDCNQIFISCTKLKSIDKIIPHQKQSTFQNWFYNCPELENVTFEGTINANGLNMSWCTKLTHDSLMNIINCLADKSADTSGTVWKVTLGSDNLAKLTESEKAIMDNKGWGYE